MLFNSSTGIEISDQQVHVVYLKGSFKGVRLAAASSCQLDTGKSRNDRQADIVDFINTFIREEKITASDIFIGIPGDQIIMREIEFPLAVRENLRTTLAYEIEKYVPLSVDDIYFDFHVIAENKEDGKLVLLLVAVKKDVFEYYTEIAAKIDRGISGIGILPIAMANYCIYHQGVEKTRTPAILIYAGKQNCEAVVLKNQSLVYATSVDFNKNDVNEDTKSRQDLIGNQIERLRKLFLSHDQPAGMIVYGLPVSEDLFNQFRIEFQYIINGNVHAASEVQLIPAFGIALNGVCDVPVDINLLPNRLRRKPDKTGFYVMFILIGLFVLGAGVWAGSHMVKQRQMLHTIDEKLAQLREAATAVEHIQSETQQIQKNITYLQSLRPDNTFAIEILEELSSIIPDGAWLSNLDIDGDKISLYGTADSATELISLLDGSPLFAGVEFLTTIRKDRDGKDVFRIKCKLETAK